MGIFELIACCQELEELNFFVLSEVWKNSPEIRMAILKRYSQLDPGLKNKDKFGTPEFWGEEPYEVVDEWNEDSQDSFETVDEWNEDDDDYEVVDEWEADEPWMVEKDYHQAGGKAAIVEDPPVDLSELYEMFPYSHDVY